MKSRLVDWLCHPPYRHRSTIGWALQPSWTPRKTKGMEGATYEEEDNMKTQKQQCYDRAGKHVRNMRVGVLITVR